MELKIEEDIMEVKEEDGKMGKEKGKDEEEGKEKMV